MGFAPENQDRTGLPAGGRWVRTLGPPATASFGVGPLPLVAAKGRRPTLLPARAWPGTPRPVQFYTRRGSSHSRDFLGDLQFSGTCLRTRENPLSRKSTFGASYARP